jgi:DNA-binding phage protein
MKKVRKRARAEPIAVKVAPFDASEFLDNEEVIVENLSAALEDPNPDTSRRAVLNVARARSLRSS